MFLKNRRVGIVTAQNVRYSRIISDKERKSLMKQIEKRREVLNRSKLMKLSSIVKYKAREEKEQ